MAFNYQKLLGRITEKMGSQAEFARRMELSERTISLKLSRQAICLKSTTRTLLLIFLQCMFNDI